MARFVKGSFYTLHPDGSTAPFEGGIPPVSWRFFPVHQYGPEALPRAQTSATLVSPFGMNARKYMARHMGRGNKEDLFKVWIPASQQRIQFIIRYDQRPSVTS